MHRLGVLGTAPTVDDELFGELYGVQYLVPGRTEGQIYGARVGQVVFFIFGGGVAGSDVYCGGVVEGSAVLFGVSEAVLL